MSEPFLGEIKIVSFNFPPKGWAFCNGQLLAINQNQALFSLLGTNYGGNGQTTFGLPDLRDRAAVNTGQETGPLQLRPRPDGRPEIRHADDQSDPNPHPHPLGGCQYACRCIVARGSPLCCWNRRAGLGLRW